MSTSSVKQPDATAGSEDLAREMRWDKISGKVMIAMDAAVSHLLVVEPAARGYREGFFHRNYLSL
jgi:hypothetical protein